MGPDHCLMGAVDPFVVGVVDVGADLRRSRTLTHHRFEDRSHIVHLTLDHEDQRATVTELGVGSVQTEEVREARHCGAEIRPGIIALPNLVQRPPANAADLHRGEKVNHIESGRPDEDVGGHLLARRGHHEVGANGRNGIVNEMDMRSSERSVPAIVEEHALAERRVVGQDVRKEIGTVTDLVFDVAGERPSVTLVDRVQRTFGMGPVRILLQRVVGTIVEGPTETDAIPEPIQRHLSEKELHIIGNRHPKLLERCRPMSRSLEDVQLAHPIGDGRNHLHRTCAVADDRDSSTVEIDSGGRPLRRMYRRSGEVAETGYGGNPRFVERADCADDDACAK